MRLLPHRLYMQDRAVLPLQSSVANDCHLPHGTVHAILAALRFWSIDQVAAWSLLRGLSNAVDGEGLLDGARGDGLVKGEHAHSSPAIKGLQMAAQCLCHAVFLYLRVAVVHHAHGPSVYLLQALAAGAKNIGVALHLLYG